MRGDKGFTELVQKINLLMARWGFRLKMHKGSASWLGWPNTEWVNETIWKLAYYGQNNMAFGGREEFLASGLTVPEAHSAGMLPYQIIAAVRRSDTVTPEQCRKALIDEGASILFGEEQPQLRFATEDEAEAAWKRLAERLPNSAEVWVITKEVGMVEDWTQR